MINFLNFVFDQNPFGNYMEYMGTNTVTKNKRGGLVVKAQGGVKTKEESPEKIVYPTESGDPLFGQQTAADNRTAYVPQIQMSPITYDFSTTAPKIDTSNIRLVHHYLGNAPRIRVRSTIRPGDDGAMVELAHISRLGRRRLKKYLDTDKPTIEGINVIPGEMGGWTGGELETHWIRLQKNPKKLTKPEPTPIPELPKLEIPTLLPDNTSTYGSSLHGDWGNTMGGNYYMIRPKKEDTTPPETLRSVRVVKEQVNGGVRVGWYDQFGHYHRGNPPTAE